VHQYLFFIGNFPIRMYGLMLCTAIFMATGTAYFLAYKDGRGWEKYLPDIGIYGGFARLHGAPPWVPPMKNTSICQPCSATRRRAFPS